MKLKAGISKEQGITSLLMGDDIHVNRFYDEERKKGSFNHDGWTVTADLQASTLTVQRPKTGKCPAITEVFTLQDGTLYLKVKNKIAEAKFVPGDLSMMIWEKYGIHEICCADPNRTYPVRFRENPSSPEENSIYELVWTHTDGEVSIAERTREQHTEENIRYGRLSQFAGNVTGLYVEKTTKSSTKIDKYPITMLEAIKAFNNGETKDLIVSNANFAVIFALDPTYQILNHFCVLYTAEKDHRKIIEMLDQKLASDRKLNLRGFNLSDLTIGY